MGPTHVGPRNRAGAGDVLTHYNVPMHACIAPTVGECACSAHAADECVRFTKGDKMAAMWPEYFGHWLLQRVGR